MLFGAGSLALILIAATPAVSLVALIPRETKRFSELWLLGPNHVADGYPFEISANEEYCVFVGVGNHMGACQYYMVYVKFRNQTQQLPDLSASQPSPLPPLCEFRFFVADGQSWELLLKFRILDVSVHGDSMYVDDVSINGVTFSVNSASMWDSNNRGFYYQLFFELWLYDVTSQIFRYHNRFVGIWLNTTG